MGLICFTRHEGNLSASVSLYLSVSLLVSIDLKVGRKDIQIIDIFAECHLVSLLLEVFASICPLCFHMKIVARIWRTL